MSASRKTAPTATVSRGTKRALAPSDAPSSASGGRLAEIPPARPASLPLPVPGASPAKVTAQAVLAPANDLPITAPRKSVVVKRASFLDEEVLSDSDGDASNVKPVVSMPATPVVVAQQQEDVDLTEDELNRLFTSQGEAGPAAAAPHGGVYDGEIFSFTGPVYPLSAIRRNAPFLTSSWGFFAKIWKILTPSTSSYGTLMKVRVGGVANAEGGQVKPVELSFWDDSAELHKESLQVGHVYLFSGVDVTFAKDTDVVYIKIGVFSKLELSHHDHGCASPPALTFVSAADLMAKPELRGKVVDLCGAVVSFEAISPESSPFYPRAAAKRDNTFMLLLKDETGTAKITLKGDFGGLALSMKVGLMVSCEQVLVRGFDGLKAVSTWETNIKPLEDMKRKADLVKAFRLELQAKSFAVTSVLPVAPVGLPATSGKASSSKDAMF